jgi:hypothetical protein
MQTTPHLPIFAKPKLARACAKMPTCGVVRPPSLGSVAKARQGLTPLARSPCPVLCLAKGIGDETLVIHDDADAKDVTKEALLALKEVARHVGKSDRRYEEQQLAEIEKAISELQSVLASKRRTNATRS